MGQTAEPTLARPAELLGAAVELLGQGLSSISEAERLVLQEVAPKKPARSRLSELRRAIREGEDPLGDAFCLMRSPEERRGQGATYTPPQVVESMTAWAKDGPRPARVIDPGSGSARFAVAAGRALPKAELVCVELDPVAALLARANLAAAGLSERSRVVVGDYRSFSPSRLPERARTLYIGNPPYVRHHQISPDWKQWLTLTARERGHQASQLAGLHVHFFLATAMKGAVGDRGAFITASEWLDVNYGSLVRELLLDGLGGLGIHVLDPEAIPFADAATTGVITTFEVGSKPKAIRLRSVKRVDALGRLDKGRAVSRERLADAHRWSPLIRAVPKLPEGWIELGELCRVHRGQVTGANRAWIAPSGALALPEQVMFPSVTKARELFAAGELLETTEHLRRVIDLPADLDVFEAGERKAIDRFLRRLKKAGVADGYVARNRKAWWSVGLRTPAPILATYMARRPPAFVRNLADARHINIAHGLYPREPLSPSVLNKLARALRESVLLSQGRTYSGGLTKFEPREMERLPVPSLELLAAGASAATANVSS